MARLAVPVRFGDELVPAGFDGEIWDKPGILRVEPGETRSFAMQVTLAR